MNKRGSFYTALLQLYPRAFREAFGAEMMQTFQDQCDDSAGTDGRLPMKFWLAAISDEAGNILRERLLAARARRGRATRGEMLLRVALVPPAFVLFYAAAVRTALALPHVHVNGFGVLLALGGLLTAAAAGSALAGRAAAEAIARIFGWRYGPVSAA